MVNKGSKLIKTSRIFEIKRILNNKKIISLYSDNHNDSLDFYLTQLKKLFN